MPADIKKLRNLFKLKLIKAKLKQMTTVANYRPATLTREKCGQKYEIQKLRWPVRATACTNFIFTVQTLLSSYKLYYHRTNFIFLVQTLLPSCKLYFPRTNFIIIVQTLLLSHKLYFPGTNIIFLGQNFFPRTNFYFFVYISLFHECMAWQDTTCHEWPRRLIIFIYLQLLFPLAIVFVYICYSLDEFFFVFISKCMT